MRRTSPQSLLRVVLRVQAAREAGRCAVSNSVSLLDRFAAPGTGLAALFDDAGATGGGVRIPDSYAHLTQELLPEFTGCDQNSDSAHRRARRRCIPVRWKPGTALQEAEVLMVTSSNGKGYVFPKVRRCTLHGQTCVSRTAGCEVRPSNSSSPQGGWETDETVEAAAARETVEEAGVRGVIEVSNAFPISLPVTDRPYSAV